MHYRSFSILSTAIVTLALSAHADATRSGRDNAMAQLAKMQVADGLEVKLWAMEPMVVNPADMDIDAQGRVWVTEGANYRSSFQKWGKLRPEGDRIQVLEDTNGDGQADKQTTFYQGNEINTALGICVLGDRVIVSCSPNIFLFEDKNHDLKADGPPKVLFSGIRGTDHDHGAHAFVFGPDGKLYFNLGNEGAQLKNSDGSQFIVDKAGNEVRSVRKPYQQGLVFRCNLDGTGVETLAWNFRNNYEVCVDSFGTLWQSDNDDDGNRGVRINYVMPYGNYGFHDELTGAAWNQKRANWETEVPLRHWHLNDPGVVPNLLQTGAGSPTGITVYEGKLLPEVFRNQVLHCDAGPRVVRAYPVTKSGAGYSATVTNLLSSEDDWYRPSDVTVAPDGAVFIADWNDSGVGGHYMADQKLETLTGRIYRVAPKGNKPVIPKYDLKTAKGAVAALQSPNLSARAAGWEALHAMGTEAQGELKKLWNGKDARQRARALQLLARMNKKSAAAWVEKAWKDENPDLRITALRIAQERGLDVLPYVKLAIRDADPQVRREAVLLLRHSAAPEAPALWAHFAQKHDGQDRWYLEALGIAADQQWDAYLSAWQKLIDDKWNTPGGRDVIWRSRAKVTPELLAKIYNDPATAAGEKERYRRAMDFQADPEKAEALKQFAPAATN